MPIEDLELMLKTTGIDIASIESLEDLNKTLQKEWLQLNKERWEMEEKISLTEDELLTIKSLLKTQSCLKNKIIQNILLILF